ncbi:hypothetical protein DVH05_000032 [Phytophthora capsici]|nr:hypothetical protein DVH05_000032 [Phytophthora capsici]
MPPKRREKDSTSKQVANDAAVTVVSSTAHEAVHTNAESISDQLSPVTSYQSPLKKLKKTMQRHERKTIDTIDGKYSSLESEHQRLKY